MVELDDTALIRPKSQRAKARRRRRRAISLVVYALIVFGLAWFFESRDTTTIIFVTHTEVAGGGVEDPGLSPAGLERANLLAAFLADIDVLAGLDAIYADDRRRTRQTAAPVADAMGLEVRTADHNRIVEFMDHVLTDYKGRIVLVVTEPGLVPALVAELHGHQSVPEIRAEEFDNVYIVTSPWFGKVKTLRLRYGLGWKPAAESYYNSQAPETTSGAGAVIGSGTIRTGGTIGADDG
jgi:broad specificity phosphatase PhoE